MTDERRIKASVDVVSRVVDGEAVLLDLESGKYFGLNPVGSRVWELLQEETTVTALCERMGAEFEVESATLRADVVELIEQLRERRLVHVS